MSHELPPEPPPQLPAPLGPHRVPSTYGGLVYLVVVVANAVGLVVVALGAWRRGVGVMGVALLVGAVARLLLPDRDAGMLRVRRHRWIDVLMLGGVGAALVVLAVVIPDQTP
ncbi:MAG: hypothetical protein JWR20_1744 [Marmoricola sp.]|nr:hypothetical protein [Marmoricola sp.]